MAEQPEAGHVGGGLDAVRQGVPAATSLSAAMVATACGNTSPVDLCRLLSTPTPSGLVRLKGRPARAASLRSKRSGSADAGDGHAVLRLGIVDAVAAGDEAAGLSGDVEAAAQHLLRQLERQDVARPAEQVERDHRTATHGVDVRQGVGRRDAAPVVGVVDDGREEVGRGEHGDAALDADRGRVVAVVEADEQLPATGRRPARDDRLELAGRDLAGAAAAVRDTASDAAPSRLR